jgi:hypothetical protein
MLVHGLVSVLWFLVQAPFRCRVRSDFSLSVLVECCSGLKGWQRDGPLGVAADCRNERTCPTLFNKFWDLRAGAELEQKVTSTPPKLTGMD